LWILRQEPQHDTIPFLVMLNFLVKPPPAKRKYADQVDSLAKRPQNETIPFRFHRSKLFRMKGKNNAALSEQNWIIALK